MNLELKRYYESKRPFIKRSITELFPKKCTNNWINTLTGREESPWDTKTLQLTFLDPINHYIQQKKTFYYALGSILLLELSHISPEKYQPLIGISEAFEACFQLFKDISIHEDPDRTAQEELNVDSSIKANVGVALLTLPTYPILHNYCYLEDDVRLWLFQNTNKSISRVFYAHGVSLYRKKKRLEFTSIEEYAQDSFYLNSPKLKFTIDLWLALTQHYKSPEIVHICGEIIRAFTFSYQLLSDLKDFKLWIKKNKQNPRTEFTLINNFIFLHIMRSALTKDLSPGKLILSKLMMLVEESSAENYLMQCVNKNELTIKDNIDKLPFSPEDKIKIEAYIQLMLEDFN